MKLLVVCRAFDNVAGGVERMAIALMNEMVKRGHQVFLLTWDHAKAESFYELDKKVTWHRLDMGEADKKASWPLRFKRMFKVRKIVNNDKPDVILAFQHGTFLSIRLFTAGKGVPVIAAKRNAPSILDFVAIGKYRGLIHQTLRMANKITVQFESYSSGYPEFLRDRIVTIPNPVFPAAGKAHPAGKKDKQKILLSVGRLSFQKNYTTFIKAFANLAPDFPEWKLVIAGEGERREELETLIAKCNLKNRVDLTGAISDIKKLYCDAHLFCLPSLWEGFPNALGEALAHGLPAIGFSSCAGVNELIIDGKNGLLAVSEANGEKRVNHLEKTLRTLMKDPEMRKQMGEEAIRSVSSFHPQKVYDLWETVLKQQE